MPAPALLLSLTALLGCGGGAEPAAGPAAGAGPTESQGPGKEPTVEELGGPRDSLVLAYQSDADVLLDPVSQTAADGAIIDALNMGLLDGDFDCELKYEPELATSYSFSEDQTVLTMTLRDDITWADGTPVTAEDVKFAFDLVADPQVASPRLSSIERMVEGKRPLVIDAHTLEFHFTQAYDRTTMLSHASSIYPLPKHLLEDADRATLRGNALARKPVGDGPWRLDVWKPDESIVLVPNEHFTGDLADRPRLKRMIFKIIPEYATRLLELEKGSVDWMEGIQIADADRIAAEHPEIALHRRGWRFMDYVAWNPFVPEDYKAKAAAAGDGEVDWSEVERHPLFGDPAVRVALAKAVDIQKLIDDLLTSEVTGEVYGKQAVSTVTPTLCQAYADTITPYPYDPAAAAAELAALGWTDSDGDGTLDKDGVDFRFTLMTNSGNARRAKASVIIQANLKAIGVDAQLETVESNTFFDRLRKKDYEAALAGWSAALFVDMSTMWHSGDQYEFNFVSYDNPEVDALIEQALNEPDSARNSALWRQVQERIYRDQPYLFLFWRDDIVGVSERFRDVKVDILGGFRDTETWWVPADSVKYAR